MKKGISFIYPIIAIIICYWAIRPLFSPGLYPMHDDTQPARVYEMAKALKYRQFPVRFVPDLGYGYGYPIFNYYAPLPYYIGALPYLMGIDLIDSTKIMIVIGVLLSGITMYYLAKELTNQIGGIVSAVLYIYAPYHAVNIYVRGAIGELYAYGFLPLIILGMLIIFRYIDGNKDRNSENIAKGIVIGSIGVSGVLLSHNILGLITGFFLGISLIGYFIYLSLRRKKLFIIYYLLFVVFLGFGLSSFFTLPAMLERRFTRVEGLTSGGSDFHLHFVYLDQLWDSPWGFAGSGPGRNDGMSFKIGKLHLLLGLSSIITLLFLYKRKKITYEKITIYFFLILMFFLSLFLTLEHSSPIWERIPGFSFVQYPWRFLNFLLFYLVCVISVIFILFTNWYKYLIGVFIITITLWLNVKYFVPQSHIGKIADDYINGVTIRYRISKISDEYLPANFETPNNQNDVAFQGLSSNDDMSVIKSQEEPIHKIYQINVRNPVSIMTKITYFPGWEAMLNNQRISINDINGRIGLDLPAGDYTLELSFKNTPIRAIGNTLSVLCLILVVYISLFGTRANYGNKNKN